MLPSTQQRTNGRTDVKTTDMRITYLDVTCAESGLKPPVSQMSSMEINAIVKVGFCNFKCFNVI